MLRARGVRGAGGVRDGGGRADGERRGGGSPAAVPDCDWDLVAGTRRGRPRAARAPRRRTSPIGALLAAPLAAGAIVALAGLADRPRGGPAPEAGFEATHQPAAPAPAWAALDPARTPFRLAPEDGPAIPVTAARASAILGLREDVFGLGDFAKGGAPFLRLALVTATREGASPPEAGESPYVALVRRAAEADGLSVGRVAGRTTLATGFGPLDLLDVTLAGETARACTAVRLRREAGAALALDGYVCGPADSLPEAASLGCLVERLSVAGGGPPALAAAFAAAASRAPPACRSVEATASTDRPARPDPRKAPRAPAHLKPPR